MSPEQIAQVCYEVERAGKEGPLWKDAPPTARNTTLSKVRAILAEPKAKDEETREQARLRQIILSLADGI